jgi:predicted nucleic acid-binding protein
MGLYYFDSSALVKRYAQEVGSSWVISLTDPAAGNEFFTALVTGVEIVSAMARKARLGSMSSPDATAAIGVFKAHFSVEYQVVLMTPAVLERAMNLAESHGLRAYDAVQ